MTQDAKGAAATDTQPAADTPPTVNQEGNPPSQPETEEAKIELTQSELDKRINAGRSDLGRKLKVASDRIAEQDTEIAGIRTSHEGIITTQRQAILDAIEDPAEKAKKQGDFSAEDKDTALTRRSSDLDARERQIAANATAGNSTLAEVKARELETATGIPAQRLLEDPLVKDKAEDGTDTINLERMGQLAETLKGTSDAKGITALGAKSPGAIVGAADDKQFMHDWGSGLLDITPENQKRADRLNAALPTTVPTTV